MTTINNWPGHGLIHGLETLTREVNPTANVNKFRRFIALTDEQDDTRKMLLTQTGRWTSAIARGDYRGGTYRLITTATTQWERGCTLEYFLDTHVTRKRGSYDKTSHHDVAMNGALIDLALAKAGINTAPASPSPTPSGTGVDLTGDLQAAVSGGVKPAPPRPDLKASIIDHTTWLIQVAGHPSTNQMDLLSSYAEIKSALTAKQALWARAEDDLTTAISLIMLKP